MVLEMGEFGLIYLLIFLLEILPHLIILMPRVLRIY
jgi:hypothetical protein